MGLFKADFYRFFVLGFAGGAALVVAFMGSGENARLSDNIVPPAHAETTQNAR